jgi:hypothetical protein
MFAVPRADRAAIGGAGGAWQDSVEPGMIAAMNLERVFFIYSAVLGVVVSAVLLLVPKSRTLSLGPYFWVLIGIGLFEAVAV